MKVLLANGSQVSVKDIKVNDLVKSFDLGTGKFRTDKVVNTLSRTVDGYLSISLSNGTVLEVTDEHPILKDNLEFVKAKELKTGDKLVLNNLDKVVTATINSITRINQSVAVYNLTTGTDHNFVVEDVVVHNKIAPPILQ